MNEKTIVWINSQCGRWCREIPKVVLMSFSILQKENLQKYEKLQVYTWGHELKRNLSDGESNPDLPRFVCYDKRKS